MESGQASQICDEDLSASDDLATALREVRECFVAAFPEHCASVQALVARLDAPGGADALIALEQVFHRMAGLGGTLGFPEVSACAFEFESIVLAIGQGDLEPSAAEGAAARLGEAFASDLVSPPPVWLVAETAFRERKARSNPKAMPNLAILKKIDEVAR